MARRRWGSGSVYADGDSWIARYPLGTRAGKRVTKRVRCRDKRAAEAELERMRRDYGAVAEPATDTLDVYLAEWHRGHARSVRASTARSYAEHIRLHIAPLLGGIVVARLRPADVRRLIDECERKGLSAGTTVLVLRTLSAALNAAVRDGGIPTNPVLGVRPPRIDREPVRPLTRDEADRIREAVGGHWTEPLVRLLLGSGLRLGEALGLDQRDLLLADGYVRVRRSKRDIRAVPVSDDAVDALRAALAAAPRIGDDEPVFFGVRGKAKAERLRGWSVSHALPLLLERAGLGHVHPHLLRHGVATLMLADGAPMRVIAEQLGHRNPALTSRVYAHVVPEAQREAVRRLG